MPHEGNTPIRKSLILSNDATVYVREGPIVPHEGTAPIRKSLILSNDATARVRKIPVVSNKGVISVDSVFSGSLFITEQTLSEIKQRLFYRDQIFISNKSPPAYTQ